MSSEQIQSSVVPLQDLTSERHGRILCYPVGTRRAFQTRIAELSRLSISAIEFTGTVKLGSINLLGKGTSSIVVKGLRKSYPVALKILRIDSRRGSTRNEAKILKLANESRLGPLFLGSTRHIIAMEYLEGSGIEGWIDLQQGIGSKGRLRTMIRKLLFQCYTLDRRGIDHGELSNLKRHVLISGERITLIDFESSSIVRKTSNVTSVVQYLFIGGPRSSRFRRVFKVGDVLKILHVLRKYKIERSEGAFLQILKSLNIS